MVLLVLLLGCSADVPAAPSSSPPPPIDLGPSFSKSGSAVQGCGWAYLFAPTSDGWGPPFLTASLALPEADPSVATEVSYDRDLHRADQIRVALADGADDFEYDTCTDAIGWASGVRLFTVDRGRVSFDATFVGSYSTSSCGPTIDFDTWQATVALTDLELSGPDGATAFLDSFETVVTLDTAGCVGP